MTKTAMERLSTKVAKRSQDVEVEDLLALVKESESSDAALLEDLAKQAAWTSGDDPLSIGVLLARWAVVIGEYLRQGPRALVDRVRRNNDDLPFAVGVLENAPTSESIEALLSLCKLVEMWPTFLQVPVHGLNMLLTINMPHPSEEVAARCRGYLHGLIGGQTSPDLVGETYYTLRHVGDKSTLALLAKAPDLPSPWHNARRTAMRRIRKRMKGLAVERG